MLRVTADTGRGQSRGFNPHPALGPGATGGEFGPVRRVYPFQSSPGPRAGCYLGEASGWFSRKKFQSSPGPRAGCYERSTATTRFTRRRFNPHPALGPGATTLPAGPPRRCRRFNPHPALGPGATTPAPGFAPGVYRLFQSSPGPRAGCYDIASMLSCRCGRFNPHPALGPGATRHNIYVQGSAWTGFNPHPALGPGATRQGAGAAGGVQVSILTRP